MLRLSRGAGASAASLDANSLTWTMARKSRMPTEKRFIKAIGLRWTATMEWYISAKSIFLRRNYPRRSPP